MTPEEAIYVSKEVTEQFSAGYYEYLAHGGHRDEQQERFVEAIDTCVNALEKQSRYAWHDLRKNPEDFPEDEERILFYTEPFDGEINECRLWTGEYDKHFAWFINDDCEGYYTRRIYDKKIVYGWKRIEPFEEDE